MGNRISDNGLKGFCKVHRVTIIKLTAKSLIIYNINGNIHIRNYFSNKIKFTYIC